MGGYGLLRFASALRLTRAVLVSPQMSIHPEVVPWDRRYRRDAAGFDREVGDLGSRRSERVTGVTLFDPFRPLDREHARRIARMFPGIAPVALGFGGHPATHAIGSARRFAEVQQLLLGDDCAPAAASAIHRRARCESPAYWQALARKAERLGHRALVRTARARHNALVNAAAAPIGAPGA
jgi:hypothetical protein